MERALVILVGLLLQTLLFSQSPNPHSLVDVKNNYDHSLRRYLEDISMVGTDSDLCSQTLPDFRLQMEENGNTIRSILSAYEATGDKGYLYEFIELALCGLYKRTNFYQNGGTYKHWGCDTCNNYMAGKWLSAITKFIWIVRNNNSLGSSQLYQGFSFISNNQFNQTWNTFNSLANWLEGEAVNTFFYYNFVLYETYDQFGHAGWRDWGSDATVAVINKMAPFVEAALYLYLSNTTLTSYLSKVDAFDAQVKAGIYAVTHCNQTSQLYDVLDYYPSTDEYRLYHAGFSLERISGCTGNKADYGKYTTHYEDISHYISDLVAFESLHNYYPNSRLNGTDMRRFRNNFTKTIYLGNNSFSNTVYGTFDKHWPCADHGGNYCTQSVYNNRIYAFASLAKYEGTGTANSAPFVNDIIFDYYNSSSGLGSYNQATTRYTNGITMIGHGILLKEQYRKYRPDLLLKERYLAYNQDFTSRFNIVVYPAVDNTTVPTFEPRIPAEGAFTIPSGVSSTMKADNKIVLKTGFKAKCGSFFKAEIGNTSSGIRSSASDPSKSSNYTLESIFEEVKDSVVPIEHQSSRLKVFPNPCTNYLKLEGNFSDLISLSIHSFTGQMVTEKQYIWQNVFNHSNQIELDVSELAPGFYTLKIRFKNNHLTYKIEKF